MFSVFYCNRSLDLGFFFIYVNYDHFHAEFCVALNESQVVHLLRYNNDAENQNLKCLFLIKLILIKNK